jgi:hypothetical protein
LITGGLEGGHSPWEPHVRPRKTAVGSLKTPENFQMTRRALKALILSAFASMPVVAACGGKVVSIGNNQADLAKVDPTTFSANITSCPAGFAHPNICCEGGMDTPSTCGAYLNAPFRPCDSGWQTYPNAAECCSLDDPSKCVAPTSSGVGNIGGPRGNGGGSCNWACPPGWWPEATKGVPETPSCDPSANGGKCDPPGPSYNSGSCCQMLSSGGTVCQGWGFDNSSPSTTCAVPLPSPPPIYDAGPASDGGVYDSGPSYDAGFGGYDGGPYDCDGGIGGYGGGGPVGQSCACPDGFKASSAEADVCCRGINDGTTECFSVANGGPSSSGGGSGNGSVPPSIGGQPSGPRACGGSAGSTTGASATCSCEGSLNGKRQAMDCSGTPVKCTCTVDSTVTTSFTTTSATCSDADWTKCGF